MILISPLLSHKRLNTNDVARCLFAGFFALAVACITPSQHDTRPLSQRLADEFNYDDPSGTERKLAKLASDFEAEGDIAGAAEILTQVARAQALEGHIDEARDTLKRAAALPTDAVRPHVRLLIENGRILRRQKSPAEAQIAFKDAYELALAHGENALAVDSAHMLAIVLPFDEAREWTDRGLILCEGSLDPNVRRWVGVLTNNWGWRLDEQGDHAGAALAFARAVAARRLENDPSLVRSSEFALSVQLRKLGQPAQALAIQNRLLEESRLAEERLGEILIERVESLRALGRKEEARHAAEDAFRTLSATRTPSEQIQRLQDLLKVLSP